MRFVSATVQRRLSDLFVFIGLFREQRNRRAVRQGFRQLKDVFRLPFLADTISHLLGPEAKPSGDDESHGNDGHDEGKHHFYRSQHGDQTRHIISSTHLNGEHLSPFPRKPTRLSMRDLNRR